MPHHLRLLVMSGFPETFLRFKNALYTFAFPLKFPGMQLEFTKMNGAGNDFVLMDNRAGNISITPEQAVKICDRHRGVGGWPYAVDPFHFRKGRFGLGFL